MITKLRSLFKIRTFSQLGFSLVELLIYMGLSMIILSIVSGLLISVVNIRNEAEKTSSVERDGRYVVTRLSYDINRAQDILEPAILGANSTSLQLNIDGETITYQIIDDKLYLTDTSDSYALNNKEVDVTSFDVTRLGNDGGKNGVQVNLQIVSQIESEGKIESRSYDFFVAIR